MFVLRVFIFGDFEAPFLKFRREDFLDILRLRIVSGLVLVGG